MKTDNLIHVYCSWKHGSPELPWWVPSQGCHGPGRCSVSSRDGTDTPGRCAAGSQSLPNISPGYAWPEGRNNIWRMFIIIQNLNPTQIKGLFVEKKGSGGSGKRQGETYRLLRQKKNYRTSSTFFFCKSLRMNIPATPYLLLFFVFKLAHPLPFFFRLANLFRSLCLRVQSLSYKLSCNLSDYRTSQRASFVFVFCLVLFCVFNSIEGYVCNSASYVCRLKVIEYKASSKCN